MLNLFQRPLPNHRDSTCALNHVQGYGEGRDEGNSRQSGLTTRSFRPRPQPNPWCETENPDTTAPRAGSQSALVDYCSKWHRIMRLGRRRMSTSIDKGEGSDLRSSMGDLPSSWVRNSILAFVVLIVCGVLARIPDAFDRPVAMWINQATNV